MAEYLGMGLSAMLSVRRGAEAVEFYKAAFDAEVLFLHKDEASGEVIANLAIGPANLWLSDESIEYKNFSPETLNGTTVRLVLTVEDPHAAYEQAVKAGATAICPVRDEHSWRVGKLSDPFGHVWEIGRPLK